jgi:hypothetical protein
MKILEQVGHQGDTQWYRIDSIPKTAKKIEKSPVAKSEYGGGAHILCGDYDMYEYKEGFCFNVKANCILNHALTVNMGPKTLDTAVMLPAKDHNPASISPDKYFVGIQRRYNPMDKKWQNVID